MNALSVVQLRDHPSVGGLVVVIDVIRAFTTAGAAFAAGAERILCVETLDQAFALRDTHRDAVLMGEDGGARPAGFDFGNSPVDVGAADLADAVIIQRTTNGTRGLVTALQAGPILAAAASNVTATARWVANHQPGAAATALCTGNLSEDGSCAVHLGQIMTGAHPDPARLAAAVRQAGEDHLALWSNPGDAAGVGLAADIEACADVDRYDFAMLGTRAGIAVELRAVVP
jgi:2-phosphosulfolactate phosphatase